MSVTVFTVNIAAMETFDETLTENYTLRDNLIACCLNMNLHTYTYTYIIVDDTFMLSTNNTLI
jgi:hypothetical protein